MPETFNDFVYEEVYVICGRDDDMTPDEIIITKDWHQMSKVLGHMTPGIDDDFRIIHGVIFPATYLPKSWKGRSVFLVQEDQHIYNHGLVVEASSITPEATAREIEGIVESGGEIDGQKIDIHDLYIIVGYEMKPSFCVLPEELDEAAVDSCIKILDEIKEVRDQVFTQSLTGG